MSTELQDYVRDLGFPYADRTILSFIGGSQLHGAKIKDTDDTDYYGLYIEPPAKVLGTDCYEHFVHTTGGERGGNRPSDTDVCMYGLRKWAHLACKGNPSVLHFLFAPALFKHPVWEQIAAKREAFLAKAHIGAFLGYANAQLKRLLNQQGQKNVHRPFLEEQHGYDCYSDDTEFLTASGWKLRVYWFKPERKDARYLRVQTCCSSFQVVLGGLGEDREEILYHSYAQCE